MTEAIGEACRRIAEGLRRGEAKTPSELNRLKLRVASTLNLKRIPSNSEVLEFLSGEERDSLGGLLRRKKVRTISGVSVIAVMTVPRSCPHGKCSYCPGGPTQGVPQSYTGHEPAAMRGIQNLFDPYRQVEARVTQLRAIGHPVDKAQLVIMGGTFPAAPPKYQEDFIQGCLDALSGTQSKDIVEAKESAGEAAIKNVGITVESRPDYAKMKHVDQMLHLGVTTVEIGVQNIYDDVYKLVGRGHTVEDVTESTRVLKDSGMKVCYHMMPGLPGCDFDRDLRAFREIFFNSDFKPDMLKIYPCLVVEGTELHRLWLEGRYHPYEDEEAVELIADIKKIIPEWVRIMRIQRDIPARLIEAGVTRGDLREVILNRLRERGFRCRCIRCREVGHRMLRDGIEVTGENVEIETKAYEASMGEEILLSVQDMVKDVLVGYLRLRIPSAEAHRKEIGPSQASVVRELKIVGPLTPVGKRLPSSWQHRGYGSRLLREAERISKEEYDQKRIVVNSALGTTGYYRRLGYLPEGPYVYKKL